MSADHDLGKSGTVGALSPGSGPLGDDSLASVAEFGTTASDLVCDLSLTDTSGLRTPHLVVANAGDHGPIHQFLTTVFQSQSPSDEVFASSLDDPLYEPSDRLLVRQGTQILAHLHLTNRMLQFGSLRVPVAGAHHLATLPEFRRRGFATRLLEVAEDLMREDGLALGFLSTNDPHFFGRRGWAACGMHCQSTANPRSVKAQIAGIRPRRGGRKMTVRPWRQVELPALSRIYRENLECVVGAFDRSEPYWRWIMSGRDFDHVFVAFDGPGKLELDGENSDIVGYCMMKEDQVLELMVSPDYPQAAVELINRAASEAIERDYHALTVHAPPGDPLHDLFRRAEGKHWHEPSLGGEVFMVRLLDPISFLAALCPVLHRRASSAQLSRPCELGLVIDDEELVLTISRRSVKTRRGRLPRSFIRTTSSEFTRLLFGHHGAGSSINARRVEASTRVAAQIADALFPQLCLWRSPVDAWDR